MWYLCDFYIVWMYLDDIVMYNKNIGNFCVEFLYLYNLV